jgi:hypothetical protein
MSIALAVSCDALRFARQRSQMLVAQNVAGRTQAERVLAEAATVMRRCLAMAAPPARSDRASERSGRLIVACAAPAESVGVVAWGGNSGQLGVAAIDERMTGLESQLADLEAFAADLLFDAERLVFALDVEVAQARETIAGAGGKLIPFPARRRPTLS